jgi:hypothetical protein
MKRHTLSYYNISEIHDVSEETLDNMTNAFTWGDTPFVFVLMADLRECLADEDLPFFESLHDGDYINIA